MRLILERSDILRILGDHLKQELTDEDVVIRTEPFEIELRNVDTNPAAGPAPLAPRGERHVNEGPSEDEGVPEPALSEEDLALMIEQEGKINAALKREIDAKIGKGRA